MHVATVIRDNVKTWRIQPGHVWRHASRRIYIILNVFYNVNRASRVRRTQTLIRENTYFQLCSDETYKIHLDRFQSISNRSLKPLSKYASNSNVCSIPKLPQGKTIVCTTQTSTPTELPITLFFISRVVFTSIHSTRPGNTYCYACSWTIYIKK